MQKSGKINILTKFLGLFFIFIGIALLFIKIIRKYIPALDPYSFGLFLIGPSFLMLGISLLWKDVDIKFLKVGSSLLMGISIIYTIILSASWFCLYIV